MATLATIMHEQLWHLLPTQGSEKSGLLPNLHPVCTALAAIATSAVLLLLCMLARSWQPADGDNEQYKSLVRKQPPQLLLPSVAAGSIRRLGDGQSLTAGGYGDFSPLGCAMQVDARPTVSEQPRGWLAWLLHVEYGRGRLTLPWQAAGHRFMRWLIIVPLLSMASMGFTAVWVLPRLVPLAGSLDAALDVILASPLLLALAAASLLGKLAYDVGRDGATFAYLLRGLQRAHLPADRPRLLHAVIVCAYKEPYDVLATTIKSLRSQTLAANTIVVLATEARDDTADETFWKLHEAFGDKFQHFMQTKHTLSPGEVAGKSSNERCAALHLFDYVAARGVDPYSVMVTTCDADSHFDKVFLEQLESEYCKLPDGRHTLFDSPINVYRNLADCNALVAAFEIDRTQYCTFTAVEWQPTQSNYSLTLGFLHAIDYWHPDNTSEDLHTTLKATAYTNGSNVVVPVWSLILNDSVTGLADRWTQAKRHMWGIEETAWVLSLFPLLRLKTWARMLQLSCGQMLTTIVVPPWLVLLIPQTRELLAALPPRALWCMAASTAAWYLYTWARVFVREAFLHRCILAHRKTLLPISKLRWALLALFYPVLSFAAHLVFNVAATWAMLLHALNHVHYGYVTAPKELGFHLDSARSLASSAASSITPFSSATLPQAGQQAFTFSVPETEGLPRIPSAGSQEESTRGDESV